MFGIEIYPIMGSLGLLVLWTTAFLVAAGALRDARTLGVRARSWNNHRARPHALGCFRGRVVDADGGCFARHRTESIGHAVDARSRRIEFLDRTIDSELLGGSVELDDGTRIEVSAKDAEVWVGLARRGREAACPDDATFNRAWDDAIKPRGRTWESVVEIHPGDEVWVCGRIDGSHRSLRLTAGDSGPVVVATLDPLAWTRRRRALLVTIVIVELALAAVFTALAVHEPFVSLTSKVGALGALGHFLIVQAVGVWARDRARTPNAAPLVHRWVERPPKAVAVATVDAAERRRRAPSP